jgi:hypothetical protein
MDSFLEMSELVDMMQEAGKSNDDAKVTKIRQSYAITFSEKFAPILKELSEQARIEEGNKQQPVAADAQQEVANDPVDVPAPQTEPVKDPHADDPHAKHLTSEVVGTAKDGTPLYRVKPGVDYVDEEEYEEAFKWSRHIPPRRIVLTQRHGNKDGPFEYEERKPVSSTRAAKPRTDEQLKTT